MNHETPAYGLWSLVLINSGVFIFFALSFFRPASKRDWRSFGAFSAFLVALFVEMYGFPLTVYLLSGWLVHRFPGVNLLSHESGHLWNVLLGWKGNPHLNPIHILSNLLIGAGFVLLYQAWRVLYAAQKEHRLATTVPYAWVRHPQYTAFIMIMLGFLLQWPTIPTLILFPILVGMYLKLAKREEKDVHEEFGKEWEEYASKTPRFFPHFGGIRVAREKGGMGR